LLHGFCSAAHRDWATAADCFRAAFALTDTDPVDDRVDPEAAVGPLSGRDLDIALTGANEADLAEQSQEVPYEDDLEL
jgi:hypothetical protein